MKAYRNVAGEVREILVDIGLDGKAILPPDTTIAPRPQALPGHYVTVVGTEWVQIESPVYVESFESKRRRKIAAIGKYRDWLTEQPVVVADVKFDADDQARSRLTQALVMHAELAYLPPVWVTFDNGVHALASIDDLKVIVSEVQTAFATRFYECSELRDSAMAATSEAELDLVVIPQYGNMF